MKTSMKTHEGRVALVTGVAMVLVTMIFGMISVHLKNGFFAATNGIETPFLYAAAALGLVFTGAGAYSLDNVLDVTFFSVPYVVGTLLVLTIVSTGVILVCAHTISRRRRLRSE